MTLTCSIFFSRPLAILIYRGLRFTRKRTLKLTHASIFGTIILLVLIASWAVYDSHVLASPPIPNLYSLHSWIGLTAVLLFILQVNKHSMHRYRLISKSKLIYVVQFVVAGRILFIFISNHSVATT